MGREQQGKGTPRGGPLHGEGITHGGDYTEKRLYRENITRGGDIYGKETHTERRPYGEGTTRGGNCTREHTGRELHGEVIT